MSLPGFTTGTALARAMLLVSRRISAVLLDGSRQMPAISLSDSIAIEVVGQVVRSHSHTTWREAHDAESSCCDLLL